METFENDNYKLEIDVDCDPTNPRIEFENLSQMVCFHNRYSLGDEHCYKSNDYNGWDEMKKAIERTEDPAIILPIFLMDHSGISISTTPFGCRWDSGQVGFVFVSKEKIREEYSTKRVTKNLIEKVKELILSEVETYDQYLSGDVYSFTLINKVTNEEDSCSGFYGSDVKHNGMLDYIGMEVASSLKVFEACPLEYF